MNKNDFSIPDMHLKSISTRKGPHRVVESHYFFILMRNILSHIEICNDYELFKKSMNITIDVIYC